MSSGFHHVHDKYKFLPFMLLIFMIISLFLQGTYQYFTILIVVNYVVILVSSFRRVNNDHKWYNGIAIVFAVFFAGLSLVLSFVYPTDRFGEHTIIFYDIVMVIPFILLVIIFTRNKKLKTAGGVKVGR